MAYLGQREPYGRESDAKANPYPQPATNDGGAPFTYDTDPHAIAERIARLKELDHQLRVHAKQGAELRMVRAETAETLQRDMDVVAQMIAEQP